MTAPAGWYPEGNGQRYWDGTAWTEHRAPFSMTRPWSGTSIASTCIVVFAMLFLPLPPVSIVLSVLAIVFMFIGLRDVRARGARGSGFAIVGGVLGFVALQLAVLTLILAGR